MTKQVTVPSILNDELDVTQVLAYAGCVLLAFELVKSLIIKPIKAFYWNTTFCESSPFRSYKEDVLTRHRNEFEACLLYLRDFMEAISNEEFLSIQALRHHRNQLAHNLPDILNTLDIGSCKPLLERTDRVLFTLSNYRVRMEIAADPEFADRGIDWDTVVGSEYILFKEVLKKIRLLGYQVESDP